MSKIDLNKINERQIMNIRVGLLQYKYIKDYVEGNIKDATLNDFKKVYTNFYLKAQGKVGKCDKYFELLFSKKYNKKEDLLDVVLELKEVLEMYEFSFASKLLHTINNDLPIYDRKVYDYLKSIKVKGLMDKNNKNKELTITTNWNAINDWYKEFLNGDGQEWIKWFDSNFNEYSDISPIKKIDFIIMACSE